MVSGAFWSWCRFQDVKVYYTLLFKPFFGLVNDDSFTFCHLDRHAFTSFLHIKEFSFSLIELFGHWCSDCILIHEQIVPISFIVKVCFQDLLFFTLIIWLMSLGCCLWLLLLFLLAMLLHLLVLVLVFGMVLRILLIPLVERWLRLFL